MHIKDIIVRAGSGQHFDKKICQLDSSKCHFFVCLLFALIVPKLPDIFSKIANYGPKSAKFSKKKHHDVSGNHQFGDF